MLSEEGFQTHFFTNPRHMELETNSTNFVKASETMQQFSIE